MGSVYGGAVAAVILGLMLTACGTPVRGAAPSHHTVLHRTRTEIVHAPSEAPAPSALACTTEELSLALVENAAAAGSLDRVYQFTNRGPRPCTLYGYPTLELKAADGQIMQSHIVHEPAAYGLITLDNGITLYEQSEERTVVLPPHGSAWFELWYPDGNNDSPDACPASALLQVTPTKDHGALTVSGTAGTIRAFGSPCGTVFEKPITANNW